MPSGFLTGSELQQQYDAAQLANLLNKLKVQGIQTDMRGADLAGNALANGGGQPPMNPMAGGVPGNPQSPPQPNPAAMQNVPMPGAVPMQGGMPGGAQPGGGPIMMPQVSASQLQPPQPGGGGAPPIAAMRPPAPPQPGGAPAPQPGGAPAPQAGAPPAASPQPQVPWWKSMAAQIKQQNPNVSGKEVMSALEHMTPMMNQQNKQDFENFKLNMQNQLKEGQLSERERNDEARNKTYQENADTNKQRADTYDKSVDERNSRALDNIKIKLDAAKAKGKNAANDPAYRSLETQYKQVSQDIRAAQALGSQATPAQKLALEQRLNDLSAKMDAYQQAPESSAPSMSGSAPPAGGDTVNVISPDGTPGSIPAAQLDDAIKAGYKKAP